MKSSDATLLICKVVSQRVAVVIGCAIGRVRIIASDDIDEHSLQLLTHYDCRHVDENAQFWVAKSEQR